MPIPLLKGARVGGGSGGGGCGDGNNKRVDAFPPKEKEDGGDGGDGED